MALGPNYRKLFAATTISNLGDGVGLIAYPWLASAITRNPVLISLVAVAQRLPWLLFTLPAGVITDRSDRRQLMYWANAVRFVLTALIAAAVFVRRDAIPAPDAVDQVVGTEAGLLAILLLSTLLLGVCEVLYDNSAQTFMPTIVGAPDLERANGRMFSAELVANQFLGPPLAGVLLAVGFTLPFVVDAGTFAASAALVFSIRVAHRPAREDAGTTPQWRAEIKEGFTWLWHHPVLREMALALAGLNLLTQVTFSLFVIYGQEVLGTSTTEFAVLSTIIAVGGVLGGWCASAIVARTGPGPILGLVLWGEGALIAVAGLLSSWVLVGVIIAVTMFLGIMWNVITVSFRQTVIPDHLLGRVNSVYRFFGWGAIPIGALVGGVMVAVLDGPVCREWASDPVARGRPAHFVLYTLVATKLTTERLEAVHAAAGQPASGAVDPAPR